ncbi:MAG: xanthine dehydrogenase family protein subunit M [Planctomycetes bacterium]|nr:xanthine dehydrogenase family protein subunit M [Planctomycetota bacterium]
MRLPAFDYHAPATLDEVFAAIGDRGRDTQLLAGGTDLLPSLRSGKRRCRQVVALKGVAGLDAIRFDPETGLEIGACALLAEVQDNPAVREHYPVLASAIRTLATVQVRHKATVVGNLCNASPCADTAPPLMALGARVRIVGPDDQHELPLDGFITGPRRTAREPEELISSVLVPPPDPALRTVFLKFSPRSKVDISAVSVAAALRLEDGLARAVGIFLGTVAPTPMRAASAAAALEGLEPTSEVIDLAARTARGECQPVTDFRASKEYKQHLVEVLTRRALRALVEGGA